MIKILKDTLINPKTGNYSRKSVVLFVSFNFAMFYEGILPIISQLMLLWVPEFKFETKQYVFEGLLLFVAVLLGVTVWDKKQN